MDTVGAGDTFMAPVLSYLHSADLLSQDGLQGLDQATLNTLLTRAAKAAATNCECGSCYPPTTDALN